MAELLMCLTAKYGLSDDEIISSYARQRTKIYNSGLLEIQKSSKPFTLRCGTNPFFVAKIMTEEK
jgi:hypothetical protein